MNVIYEKDTNGIRELLMKFGKTTYGKTIFIIAYTPALLKFILFIANLIDMINLQQNISDYFYSSFCHLLEFVCIFMISNAFYYVELRKFTKELKNEEIKEQNEELKTEK